MTMNIVDELDHDGSIGTIADLHTGDIESTGIGVEAKLSLTGQG